MLSARQLNIAKLEEAGEFATRQLLWGLHVDTATQRIEVLQPKQVKAFFSWRRLRCSRAAATSFLPSRKNAVGARSTGRRHYTV